jgi:CubicO group peptidase (beta-lactamase class C family)
MNMSMKRIMIISAAVLCCIGLFWSCSNQSSASLPRGKSSAELDTAFSHYLDTVAATGLDIHSIMIVKDGKVVEEKWMSEGAPDKPHVMWSVSKSFTATAVGFAISEGRLHLDDKMVSFFPDDLPEHMSDTLASVTIRDLLTMSCGHEKDPTGAIQKDSTGARWERLFMACPFKYMPGEYFCYNTIGTYMLSSIITKVTGEKVVDYLEPRLWKPLGIEKPKWDENAEGVNYGGFGLYLKTEDMAKFGLCFLQGGKYNGKQVIPADWVKEASAFKIICHPSWAASMADSNGMSLNGSDWEQGYCYQMWRCRHNSFRADGANGQYILMIPDKNAVIAVTAKLDDMQKELNQIWDNLLLAL